MTKIVASIEARMTSTRLPGKVAMQAIDKISMLEFMISRVRLSRKIDEIILATTTNADDDILVKLCKNLGVKVFRGSENDVLSRVLNAHNHFDSDIIVELTGDCPLIDFNIIDLIISDYMNNNVDYSSNSHERSYPDGFDVQVFSKNLLNEISCKTVDNYDRENVSSYIYRSGHYKLSSIIAPPELFWPELRVTLDDHGDLLLIRQIIEHLFPLHGVRFTALDIVKFLKNNLQLLKLNCDARISISPYQKIAKHPQNE